MSQDPKGKACSNRRSVQFSISYRTAAQNVIIVTSGSAELPCTRTATGSLARPNGFRYG
jgi:hypothetical protein